MPARTIACRTHTTALATGHATADRVAAGVISLTGGRTEKETPDFLGRCGPGRLLE